MPDRLPIPVRARGTSFDPDQATSHVNTTLSLLASLFGDPLGVGQPEPNPTGASVSAGPRNLVDLVGRIFSSKATPDLRLTSGDPDANVLRFNETQSGAPYEASYSDVGRLMKGGALQPEAGPYEGQPIEQLVRRLLKYTKRAPK